MSTEIDGLGDPRGGAPRSESKMVDCRGNRSLIPRRRERELASPLGRLLSCLSCRNKKDTRRRHYFSLLLGKSKTRVNICRNIPNVVLQLLITVFQRHFHLADAIKDGGVVTVELLADIGKT